MRRKEASNLAISANKDDLRPVNPDQDGLDALESASNTLEGLATFCGVAVAAGVVLEYLPKFIDLLPHWDWPVATKELLGGTLIALGVAGEVLFGKMASRRQSSIVAIKDLRIAELNLIAEQEKSARLALETSVEAIRTELQIEQRKTAEAQQETAKAQLELKTHVNHVAQRAGPRSLSDRFLQALEGKPKGSAEIWYNPFDKEAYTFALQIWSVLSKGAGWNTSKPKPLPLEGGDPGVYRHAPPDIRYGGGLGLTLRARSPRTEFGLNTPEGAIRDALMLAVEGGGNMIVMGDLRLPDNHFVIVVSQK